MVYLEWGVAPMLTTPAPTPTIWCSSDSDSGSGSGNSFDSDSDSGSLFFFSIPENLEIDTKHDSVTWQLVLVICAMSY